MNDSFGTIVSSVMNYWVKNEIISCKRWIYINHMHQSSCQSYQLWWLKLESNYVFICVPFNWWIQHWKRFLYFMFLQMFFSFPHSFNDSFTTSNTCMQLTNTWYVTLKHSFFSKYETEAVTNEWRTENNAFTFNKTTNTFANEMNNTNVEKNKKFSCFFLTYLDLWTF